MPSLKERASARARALRERRPALDHWLRAFDYYDGRNGNAHAAAVAFFGFLSFFPLLALAFFVIGYLSKVAPEARGELVDAIDSIFPGLIGSGRNQISLTTFEVYAGTSVSLGLAGLLYTGLAWVSAMRRALGEMLGVNAEDRLGLLPGKTRDLGMLVVLGIVLVLSVSLSGTMTWFSEGILRGVGVDQHLLAEVLLWVVTHTAAVLATTLLLMTMFALVPRPPIPRRAMWQGALIGALGFEVLKSVAGLLISMTTQRPAFQAFGVALIVVVWINYFSRLVMLSAAWAWTGPVASAVRRLEGEPLFSEAETESLVPAPAAVVSEDPEASPGPEPRGGPLGVVRRSGSAATAVLTRVRRRVGR
jgi:membrane protein